MGFRYRKTKSFKNGVKVSAGKSTSVGYGGKRAGVSINSKRGVRVRASIPGTGISYSAKLGGSHRKHKRKKSSPGGIVSWIICLLIFVLCCSVLPVLIPVFIIVVVGILVWAFVSIKREQAAQGITSDDVDPMAVGSASVLCPGCSESFTVNYRADAVRDGALEITCPKCGHQINVDTSGK